MSIRRRSDSLLETIPLGKPTEPLIVPRRHRGHHGLHARTEKRRRDHRNTDPHRLINERVEMMSRQAMRDLHRKANIDIRGNGV